MNPVKFGSAADVVTRMPSPKIWADCPILQFEADPAKGFYLFDDFKNSVNIAKGTKISQIGGDINWYAHAEGDDAADISLNANDDGVLDLVVDTDSHVTAITTGNLTAGIIRLPKKGERKRFWFETRLQVSSVTANAIGFFVGLAQPGLAADTDVFGGDCAALAASIDYLGFCSLQADSTGLDVVYLEGSSGTAQAPADVTTLAALTWVRLGMRLDVSEDKIKCYVDGVYAGDTYDIDISSINFPSNTDVDVLIDLCGGSGGGGYMLVDWVRVAQDY